MVFVNDNLVVIFQSFKSNMVGVGMIKNLGYF